MINLWLFFLFVLAPILAAVIAVLLVFWLVVSSVVYIRKTHLNHKG